MSFKARRRRMRRDELIMYLRARGACDAARIWILNNPWLTPAQLWEYCPRAEWLAWLASYAGIPMPEDESCCWTCLAFSNSPDKVREIAPWATVEANLLEQLKKEKAK